MITIKKVSRGNMPDLILLAFEGDVDLIEKYHAINGDLSTSVYDTIERINIISTKYRLRYYKVLYKQKPIGFFVVRDGGDFLISFGINIKYRNFKILKSWFSHVRKELNTIFACVLNQKNERAIRFLERQGLKIEYRDEVNKTVTLLT